MKKNTSLYIYLLLLLITVEAGTGFCQNTPCITAITGNNDKTMDGRTILTDSGSAIIQEFRTNCNGNLSSFSFSYRVLENQGNNNKIEYPVNNAGNPYFVVDLTIYELATGQSIDETPTSSLSQVFKQSNIQVSIVKPNPREDFAYFTIPIPITPGISLLSTKLYCFVIQLNAAFCNDLITKKRTRLGSSYNPPKIGEELELSNLIQKDICDIELATRQIINANFFQKDICLSKANNNELSRVYTTTYQGFDMTWEKKIIP